MRVLLNDGSGLNEAQAPHAKEGVEILAGALHPGAVAPAGPDAIRRLR